MGKRERNEERRLHASQDEAQQEIFDTAKKRESLKTAVLNFLKIFYILFLEIKKQEA
jgi:hypothetical protein